MFFEYEIYIFYLQIRKSWGQTSDCLTDFNLCHRDQRFWIRKTLKCFASRSPLTSHCFCSKCLFATNKDLSICLSKVRFSRKFCLIKGNVGQAFVSKRRNLTGVVLGRCQRQKTRSHSTLSAKPRGRSSGGACGSPEKGNLGSHFPHS